MAFLCTLLISFVCSADTPTIKILYDSKVHRLSNIPSIFSVTKIDVSVARRIEASISQRLRYPGVSKSVEQVESWAKQKIESDPEILSLIKHLPDSYAFVEEVNRLGVTKVPAVVYSTGEEDFVVYGKTNIQEAIQEINAYRMGTMR